MEMIISSTQINLMDKRHLKNTDIIVMELEAQGINFEYNGENLKTYAAWKIAGYQVKRGSKALVQCDLWTPCKAREEKQDGSKEEKTRMFLKKSSLFSIDQVEAIKTA